MSDSVYGHVKPWLVQSDIVCPIGLSPDLYGSNANATGQRLSWTQETRTTAGVDMKTNDSGNLTIHTDLGTRVLEFDFPSFCIGIAEYPDGPTGVTALHFPSGVPVAMDIRGGATGFVGDYGFVHAISLAGGSIFGLEAASGIAAEILAHGGYQVNWEAIPLVSGGIIYDFGGRENSIYPDRELGRAALQNVRWNQFALGARGAGISASVGKASSFLHAERAGQGAAFREVGGVKFFACTVVNALGAVYDRSGRIVRGNLDPETGQRLPALEELDRMADLSPESKIQAGNTTLTVLITNQVVKGRELTQLGRQVHSAMARVIQPFHTSMDGDILWTISTGEVADERWSVPMLGVAASEVVWDAVLAVHP